MSKNKQFKKRGIILGIFLFAILLISFISAVPPITQVQQFAEGYVIQVPQDNILKLKQDYLFEFHVNNISNGVPINSGISCNFHLYNSSGDHKLTMINSIASSGLDYSFLVNGNNFTEIGNFYYYVSCNSSSLGGYRAISIEVTQQGDEINTSQSLIYVILLIINLLFLALFLILSVISPYENKKEMTREGMAITKVTKTKYIKLFCMWLSYGLFLWLITIISGMINNYVSFDPLKDMISNIYLFSSTLGYGVTIFMVWFILLNIWKDIVLNKKILKEGKALLRELGKK
jgi:hypothetical protein